MGTEKRRVQRVGAEHFDEIVATLADAFREYPVMRFVLRDAGERYDSHLHAFVGYLADQRASRGWPMLAVEGEAGSLAAAALVNPPIPPASAERPAPLVRRYRSLARTIGAAAIGRFRAFANACEPLEPREPHHYLGMIGARAAERGRGHARLLLDAVHGMADADPASSGVALTTETRANLPLYEHFGYRLLGRVRLEELETWTLFRPRES
jgi:GNAT superfamily N-acetyltransferase